MNQTLKVKKLDPKAVVPERKLGSNGYDLHSLEHHMIKCGETKWIHTGIAVVPPKHTYIRIAMRSGISGKGLMAGAGVVDTNYRGELKVCIHNNNHYFPIEITPEKAFAQFVCEVCKTPEVEVVEELDSTERGDRGFGSTDANSTPTDTNTQTKWVQYDHCSYCRGEPCKCGKNRYGYYPRHTHPTTQADESTDAPAPL